MVGGDAGEGVGMDVEVAHLGPEDPVEPNIGHEDGDHGDVGHAPFAGLEGEVVDDLVLSPFPLAQEADAGGQKLGNREEDTEGEDKDTDEDRVVLAGGDQDADDVEDAFTLEEDHLILERDGLAQQLEIKGVDAGVNIDHGRGEADDQEDEGDGNGQDVKGDIEVSLFTQEIPQSDHQQHGGQHDIRIGIGGMLEDGQRRIGIFLEGAVGIEMISLIDGVEGFLLFVLRAVIDVLAQVLKFVFGQVFQAAFAAGR